MGAELKSLGLRSNHSFEESFFDQGVSVEHLVFIIERLPEGTTELMCHPAYEDAELAASSSYAAVRVKELAALCDPRVRTAIDRAGVHLITFSEL